MSNPNSLMKGHPFKKHAKKMTYPAIAEEKIDEIRLDVRYVEATGCVLFHSYADKPLHNLTVFEPAFKRFMVAHDTTRLDMGVIVNRNFDDTYSWVRSSKGIPEALNGSAVEFILFDLPDYGGLQFINRRFERTRAASLMRDYTLPVFTPESRMVESAEEVQEYFEQVNRAGGEGLMVKSLDHLYVEGTRSYGWLKLKAEETIDGVITGYEEAVSEDGTPLGRVGSVFVVCEDGSEASPHGLKHDLATDIFNNFEKYSGRWCEFVYMERDRQGGYRHPRFKRLREPKA